jgi:hypothetical protein
MDIKQMRIEIRKHHVTPDVYVLDVAIESDAEKLVKQTQHKSDDQALKKFVEEAVRISKELAFARKE